MTPAFHVLFFSAIYSKFSTNLGYYWNMTKRILEKFINYVIFC